MAQFVVLLSSICHRITIWNTFFSLPEMLRPQCFQGGCWDTGEEEFGQETENDPQQSLQLHGEGSRSLNSWESLPIPVKAMQGTDGKPLWENLKDFALVFLSSTPNVRTSQATANLQKWATSRCLGLRVRRGCSLSMGTRDLNGLKEVFWNRTVVMAAYLSKFYTEH